jgi:superfamily I DNA and/or RNA helicase
MAEIKEIFKQYPEEILKNTLVGKVISGNIEWKDKPLLLLLEKKDANEMLFSIDKQPLRINFEDTKSVEIDTDNSSYFSHIFWISNYNDGNKRVEIKYLRCGNGQIFRSSLDIGFGDIIIQTKKSAKIDKIPDYLFNDYAYKAGNSVILFVETFPNSDRNFRLYGENKRADIQDENEKWIIIKETKKPFPRKYDNFLSLNVAQYDSVSFVESSKAKEAYETIKSEEAKGGTLIKLWEIYSRIELERANQLKEKTGEIKFKKIRSLPDEITRIKIELNNELKAVINENRDDILNTAFELVPEADDTLSKGRFNIKSINKDYTLDLYDELYSIPESGTFSISIIGDEIVNKRRERALKNLREQRTLVTTNLRFAIEGMRDAMLEKPRKEKALTERTQSFLKDKFGIDNLTKNQKDAVEIAINTPDIAIIQGPPGTGKSTVVAAICDRLIEIAEKDKYKKSDSKLILVSAFQNDTVEHIASKIYTLGLPTIKIGKETQGNIRAEEVLIKDIRRKIDDSLQRLAAKDNSSRVSKQLRNIKALYEQENSNQQTKEAIDALLRTVQISDSLWNAWKEIFADKQYNVAAKDKNITAVKGVRTESNTYDDDGFEKVQRLLKTDIPFSEEEKIFLEDSPLDNPSADFLIKLKEIKDKHMEKLYALENRIEHGNDLSLKEWIDDTIGFFKQKEEMAYDDEDTFLTAVLESLREDLDGNTDYIRDSIKGYGESLAATNQVAGGQEMSSYRTIDNVILEEAARSNPLDLIIPMSKATERIIMVGDQNQLPHLLEDDIADETATKFSDEVKSAEARKKLEESLFGVIFRNLDQAKPRRRITLTEQFRMHPVIGDFISKIYYNNELKQGMTNQAEKKQHNLSIDWAKNKVTIFCDVNKQKGLEQSGKSKSRQSEAIRIINLLDELKYDANFENISIGIITFYAKQVELLFNEASKKGYAEQNADGSHEISRQYKETRDGREKLRIGSVDSFQGKEFDIVILSTVRSNEFKRSHENHKKVFGFLTLQNRLNVAFSRAQKLVIVVGDGAMFADEFAKTYVEGLHEFYTQLSLSTDYGNRI